MVAAGKAQAMANGAAVMVMLQEVLVAPLASVTLSVKVPGEVAVPVMAPVLVFRVSPPGNVPTIEKV
jgi:hypothetical protein